MRSYFGPNPKDRDAGTTLPELLVCMAVMGVILFLAARMVTYAYDFYHYTDESISLQREGLLALQALTEDITASHQRSIVTTEQVVTTPAPSHNEDLVVIPMPYRMDGMTEVNSEGASKWMSIVGYEIDTSSPTRNLIRYLGDTINDPGDNFRETDPGPPSVTDYTADIETVDVSSEMPTVAEIKAFPAIGLRVKSVCRNVFSFKVKRSVDVVEIDVVILLPGRIQGGTSLDNSLSLNTTVLPRN